MIILPAIDIRQGQCVRLTKGDFNTVEKVAADPLETALSFKESGAQWLHMVDLDGALEGRAVNAEVFTTVAEKSGLKVELGGGIRTLEQAAFYLDRGLSRVIFGSAALSNEAMVAEAVKEYGDKIAVGIDARNGKVSVAGWVADSEMDFVEMAKRMEGIGVRTLIFTDISKDGTLSGPNLEQLGQISEAVSCQIIASGGIKEMKDIRALADMGLYGAICGKSIYKGTLDLEEAISYCNKEK